MNLLPIANEENLSLLVAIGKIVANNQKRRAVSAQELAQLKAKPLNGQALELVEVVDSLFSRNHPFDRKRLVQDVESEKHFIKRFKAHAANGEQQLAAKKRELEKLLQQQTQSNKK